LSVPLKSGPGEAEVTAARAFSGIGDRASAMVTVRFLSGADPIPLRGGYADQGDQNTEDDSPLKSRLTKLFLTVGSMAAALLAGAASFKIN
jgi:hypothetical protein